MEEGLAYRVDCNYDNFCVRLSNDKILFINNGKLYDQLNKVRDNYCLYKFINENVKIDDKLVARYVIYFSYKKCVIIVWVIYQCEI